MVRIHRWLLISAVTTIMAGSAAAQTGGGSTGGGSTGGGSSSGAAGGGLGSTSGSPAGAVDAPQISAPSTAPQTSQALSNSNSLNYYYANPYYQGRAGTMTATTSSTNTPGGFGTALYNSSTSPSGVGGTGGFGGASGGSTGGRSGGTTSTSAGFGGTSGGSTGGLGGGTGGRAGGTSSTGFGGSTGSSGGFGGTSGSTGGFGGSSGGFGNSNQQNNSITGPRAISYTATVRFATKPVTQVQLGTDIRDMLSSSSSISRVSGIQIELPTTGQVVLRGTVLDEDEARLIEGMVRLTPGVRDVKNELKFPVAPVAIP